MVKVWVAVKGHGQPFGVYVPQDVDIDDAVRVAIKNFPGHVMRASVAVEFPGVEDFDLSTSVTDESYKTTSKNPLWLILRDSEALEPYGNVHPVPKKQKIEFTQPTLGSMSPSVFSKAPRDIIHEKVHKNTPLYTHWFALELYNQVLKLEAGTMSSVDLNENTYTPLSTSFIAERFDAISSFEKACIIDGRGIMSNHELKECELSQTACYARAFDRFLFADHDKMKGACFHQLPVYKKKGSPDVERTDVTVAGLCGGPINPVLVSDIKRECSEIATNETAGYAIRAMSVMSDAFRKRNMLNLMLGLPICDGYANLLLYVGDNAFVHEVEICSVNVGSEQQTKLAFFSVLFGAVHALLDNPVVMTVCGMKPMKNVTLFPLVSYSSRNVRVYHEEESGKRKRVYKFYDSEIEEDLSPNTDIMNLIRDPYLPNMSQHALTTDGRVQCLQYDYIDGSHDPARPQQFAAILEDLICLHGKGYVHSDVRKENLLFSRDGERAWIIDFDIAGRIDSPYPSRYNHHDIKERHPLAIAMYPRKAVHDVYALCALMEASYGEDIEEVTQLLLLPEPKHSQALYLLERISLCHMAL